MSKSFVKIDEAKKPLKLLLGLGCGSIGHHCGLGWIHLISTWEENVAQKCEMLFKKFTFLNFVEEWIFAEPLQDLAHLAHLVYMIREGQGVNKQIIDINKIEFMKD